MRYKSIVGKRFGTLTIIRKIEKNNSIYECLCDCGKKEEKRLSSLAKGGNNTKCKSCKLKNRASNLNQQQNDIFHKYITWAKNISFVNKYKKLYDKDDIEQVALLGLYEGVLKYTDDFDDIESFKSFAKRCIKFSIFAFFKSRYMQDHYDLVKNLDNDYNEYEFNTDDNDRYEELVEQLKNIIGKQNTNILIEHFVKERSVTSIAIEMHSGNRRVNNIISNSISRLNQNYSDFFS